MCERDSKRNTCRRKKVKLHDLREHNIDRLCYYLGVYPWGYFLQSNDVEYIYLHFADIVLHILSECVPAKTVVLGPKDPQYVTPLVKMLLKRHNRLRRQGRHDEANVVAQKINNLITTNRSSSLNKLSSASTKELWAAVNKTRNSANSISLSALLRDPDVINSHFAKIAFKNSYDHTELDGFRRKCNSENFDPLSNIEVEALLRNIY